MTNRYKGLMAWLALVGLFYFVSHAGISAQSQNSSGSDISRVSGRFVDVTEKVGIRFVQKASPTSRKYLLETMGSGVAVFDYDNDGRLDIFFANGRGGAQTDHTDVQLPRAKHRGTWAPPNSSIASETGSEMKLPNNLTKMLP